MKVDNTMLSTLDDCMLKYRESMEDHWTSRFQGGALGHGIAMHAGLAAWYQGLLDGETRPQRMEKGVAEIARTWNPEHPVDDYRTLERAQRLFLGFIKEYPQESFQILAVEVPYVLPLSPHAWLDCANSFLIRDPISGIYSTNDVDRIFCPGSSDARGLCQVCDRECEPIEYGGIYDLLVQFGGGRQSTVYVVDHKTTSQLGSTYFLQFNPNNQITGYCWGAEQMSTTKVAGAIINALCLTTSGNMKYARDMTARTPADYAEFRSDVIWKCNAIAQARRTGVWPKSTNHCQGKYGMCDYHSIHVLSNESERQLRRETDYVKRVWDFENRDGSEAT